MPRAYKIKFKVFFNLTSFYFLGVTCCKVEISNHGSNRTYSIVKPEKKIYFHHTAVKCFQGIEMFLFGIKFEVNVLLQ